MALKFKVGEAVRQVLPAPLVGTVAEATIAGDQVMFRVEAPDGATRWFAEDDIEAAP